MLLSTVRKSKGTKQASRRWRVEHIVDETDLLKIKDGIKKSHQIGVQDWYQLKGLKDLWAGRPDGVLGRFCSKLEFWQDLADWVESGSVEKKSRGVWEPAHTVS